MAEVTVVVYLPYIAYFGDMALPSQTIEYRLVVLLQVKQLDLRKRAYLLKEQTEDAILAVHTLELCVYIGSLL